MTTKPLLEPLWWLTSRPWMKPVMGLARAVLGPDRLRRWKQKLKPRLSPSVAWNIDAVHRIDRHGAFVIGWLLDPTGEVVRFEMESEGQTINLKPMWARCARKDVVTTVAGAARTDVDVGFVCWIPGLPVAGSCVFRVTNEKGAVDSKQVGVRDVASPLEWSKEALVHLSMQSPFVADIIQKHIGPPLRAMTAIPKVAGAPTIREFGPRPSHPAITLLIPLYGRADFLRYQTALFASDAEMRDVELLYVVDDPRLTESVCQMAMHAYQFQRLPITLVINERNLGFSGANNVGASVARGETLVLLNSDVFPGAPGWLSKLIAPLADPEVGLVGAKLIYEDGTIQHDGMRMTTYEAWGGLPILLHPGKGMPDQGAGPAVADAEAVTGACLAIRAKDYRALGGLDEGYMLGDFEDSDLCLRVRRAGRSIKIVRDVSLFHLERQSQWLMPDMDWRQKITVYNCWRHAQALKGELS